MKAKATQAQELLWEIWALRESGDTQGAALKSRKMARLHEELAKDALEAQSPHGWPDLFAAITAWGKAGTVADRMHAASLLDYGYILAQVMGGDRTAVRAQLKELLEWLVRGAEAEAKDPPSGRRPRAQRRQRRKAA